MLLIRMKFYFLLLINFLFSEYECIGCKNADDYYHFSKQKYIMDANTKEKVQAAKNLVKRGIEKYPNDKKLKELINKFREPEMQESQSQDGNSQNTEQQDGETEEGQDDGEGEERQDDGETEEGQDDGEGEERQDDGEGDIKNNQEVLTPEQILAKEEAEAILNSLKANQNNLMKRKYKSMKSLKVIKDW